MKQSKDALSIILKFLQGAHEEEEKQAPTPSWQERLMEDVARQPLPKRAGLRGRQVVTILLLVVVLVVLYCVALR